MNNKNIVLFSGGTGGHVIPSVILGNNLISRDYNVVLFLDKRGLKYAKNFNGRIVKINSAHLSGKIIFKLKSIFLLLSGLIQSTYYLFSIRPSHCISFGSYLSLTVMM